MIRGLKQLARTLRADSGSITPLAIIYAVIALAAALLLFAAADLYLERKQLFTHADAAALTAANTFELGDVAATEGNLSIQLQQDDAVQAAESYLLTHASTDAELVSATVDGDTVTLHVQGEWRAEVGGMFFPISVPLSVEVSAQASME
ncbi:MAG: pilus assembly protein TadG-related protein [Gulosibacter sp.]|uniref:pilus assembly protein TadG-related protein n=1 Tax=Gulosibacter sp. TaxID=2817531 RepID=UPI003F912152